jgi:hypothetical protein
MKEPDKNENVLDPRYEQVWSMQEAINKAVAENRVVRFLSDKSTKELKSEIVDKKGCLLRKPDKESNDIAVIPPGIEDFSFDQVDTSIATWEPGNIHLS